MDTVRKIVEASSSKARFTYDVFLSFRGEDTRKNFTDHLYTALTIAGFRTFRDSECVETGEDLTPQLEKAIRESEISVIVFSRNYASSTWCLNEVALIMECNKSTDRIMVLPVYYDVEPSDVRKQTGSFENAFLKHEERFRKDINKVERWREALRQAAELVGMPLQNQADGHEAQFIKNIIDKIVQKLGTHTELSVAPFTTGSDSIVNEINIWLQDGSNDISIGMILGMGGIGKTNIAKIVYNINCKKFDGSSFLLNVKASKEEKELVSLQKQVCRDILKKTYVKINNSAEGNAKIKQVVGTRKILLVLDDVDDFKQLCEIMGRRNWFHPGSKILITTRNQRSIESHETCKIFEVQLLGDDKSLQLFSLHAFGQNDPIDKFKELSQRVVRHCGGLPLALEVLGRSFSNRRKKAEWKDLLGELEEKSNICEILIVLEISYNSLQEDHIKDLFLDIACFFVGLKQEYVATIFENANVGIKKLIDKCLISVDAYNRIRMHQLLQDMGRNVVIKESPKELGERSRLWNHKDASFVLETKTGTKKITGIIVNGTVIGSTFLEYLSTDGFTEMHNLRLLSINDVQKLTGDYNKFPRRIRWLCSRGFPLEYLPPGLYLKELVFLDMKRSKLKHLDKNSMDLPKLKFFNLSHSHDLIYISDLSKLTSLQTLILKDCISLVEIHESIAHLPSLTSLNFGGCKKLGKLPLHIRILKSFRLSLSGFSKLEWPVRFLCSFDPFSSLPSTLVDLKLGYCNLTSLSNVLSGLSSLKKLDLSGNPIQSISGANNVNNLKVLVMLDCTSLQSVNCLPSSLGDVLVDGCKSLKSMTFQYDANYVYIDSKGCSELHEVFHLFKLDTIGNIDPEIKNRFGLPSLEFISSIEVEIYNDYIQEASKLPLQVLHEVGVNSIYLPASDVQECFGLKLNGSETWFNAPLLLETDPLKKVPDLVTLFLTGGEAGEFFGWKPMEETPSAWFQCLLDHSLSPTSMETRFEVPACPNQQIIGFNIGIVFARNMRSIYLKNHLKKPYYPSRIQIEVGYPSPRSQRWYKPRIYGFPKGSEDMIWFSHWMMEEGDIKAGDEVRVEFNFDMKYFVLKEIGIHIVYEKKRMVRLMRPLANYRDHICTWDRACLQIQ